MKLNKTYPIASFKALEDEGPGKFQAVVSVFGNVDLQGDRVMPGAFKNTLKKWQAKGDPIPVIWSHDWMNPDAHIGYVDAADAQELIDEDSKANGSVPTGGLLVKGHMDVHKPFAAQVFDLLKDRRVKEWSFAYDVNDEAMADDGANELKDLELLEVGPCLKGANPETYTVSAKSALEKELKEAYELQRHVARLSTWQDADPEVVKALSKAYGIVKHERELPKLFHVERRSPAYDGPYSLEQPDTFVCIDDETKDVLDSHKSYEGALEHVDRLKKDEHLTDEQIAEAVADADAKTHGTTIVDESILEGPVVDDADAKVEGKPWHIEERGGEFCVIKDADSSQVACHATREDAEAQLRALYASESSDEADSEKAEKFYGSAPTGSVEARQEAVSTAAREWARGAYPGKDGYETWTYVVATYDSTVVVCVESFDDAMKTFELDYEIADDGTASVSNPREVTIETRIVQKARKRLTENEARAREGLSPLQTAEAKVEQDELVSAVKYITTASNGGTYNITTSDGKATWLISSDGNVEFQADDAKIGRRIGEKAAAALKARLTEAVDTFVKEINGLVEDESADEKTDDPDVKRLAELNAQLDALGG